MLGKKFSRWHFEVFFLFFLENGILHFMQIVSLRDSLHEVSDPKETICMKCHILFSWKNKKNVINSSSAESALSVVSVKAPVKSSSRDILRFLIFREHKDLTFQMNHLPSISYELSTRQMIVTGSIDTYFLWNMNKKKMLRVLSATVLNAILLKCERICRSR